MSLRRMRQRLVRFIALRLDLQLLWCQAGYWRIPRKSPLHVSILQNDRLCWTVPRQSKKKPLLIVLLTACSDRLQVRQTRDCQSALPSSLERLDALDRAREFYPDGGILSERIVVAMCFVDVGVLVVHSIFVGFRAFDVRAAGREVTNPGWSRTQGL